MTERFTNTLPSQRLAESFLGEVACVWKELTAERFPTHTVKCFIAWMWHTSGGVWPSPSASCLRSWRAGRGPVDSRPLWPRPASHTCESERTTSCLYKRSKCEWTTFKLLSVSVAHCFSTTCSQLKNSLSPTQGHSRHIEVSQIHKNLKIWLQSWSLFSLLFANVSNFSRRWSHWSNVAKSHFPFNLKTFHLDFSHLHTSYMNC